MTGEETLDAEEATQAGADHRQAAGRRRNVGGRQDDWPGVETLYVEPASPWENGYAESFHSRLRNELTDGEDFVSLAEAK